MPHKTLVFSILLSLAAFPAMAEPLRIVALGDSLTAGYGLAPHDAYPAQLEAALYAEEEIDAVVENAGVSGDTTAGGVARLERVIAGQPKPRLVIVALGANDMLRGISPAVAEKNLRTILTVLKQRDIPAILIGVQVGIGLPMMGGRFDKLYDTLADDFDVPLYENFLDDVALKPQLNIADGFHPNAAGVAIMVSNTLPTIVDALED